MVSRQFEHPAGRTRTALLSNPQRRSPWKTSLRVKIDLEQEDRLRLARDDRRTLVDTVETAATSSAFFNMRGPTSVHREFENSFIEKYGVDTAWIVYVIVCIIIRSFLPVYFHGIGRFLATFRL